MNVLKSLRLSIIGLVILTIILFVLSLYTLFSGLFSAISDDAFKVRLDKNNSTGDWSITLDANPRNNAFLDVRLFVELGITTLNGEYIAKNSTSVHINPGSRSPFSVTLTIPRDVVQEYDLEAEQGAAVLFEMKFGIRTLADLVGFTQTMRISGGPNL